MLIASEENTKSDREQFLFKGSCWAMGKAQKMIADEHFSGKSEAELKNIFNRPVHIKIIDDLKADKYKDSESFASEVYNNCLSQFSLNSNSEKEAAKSCYGALKIHDLAVQFKDAGYSKDKANEIFSSKLARNEADKVDLKKIVSEIFSSKNKKEENQKMHIFFNTCVAQVKTG
jgi:hypothetical protein